jgi:hypothetical protein
MKNIIIYRYIKVIVSSLLLYISIILFSCNYYHYRDHFKIDNLIKNSNPIIIPFRFENNRVIFEVTINEKTGIFFFDTGAPVSLINANIPIDNLQYLGNVDVTSMGIREKSKVYRLKTITINDITLNINSAIIPASEKHITSSLDGFDGILGIDIFNGYWCEISFSKNALILHKEKPDYFTQSVFCEYTRDGEDFYISMPVNVDNQIVYFAIDTGMPQAIFFHKSMINKKQKEDYTRFFTNDRIKKSYFVRTKLFTIFDEHFTDKWVITNSYHSENGLLGIDFLKYYDILLDLTDMSETRTSLVYYKPIVPAEERNYGYYSFITNVPASGILKIRNHCKGIIIDDIIEDSPAYKEFGLRPNMIITRLNGIPLEEIPWETLSSPSFPDTVKECTVLKNNKERTIVRKNR